MKLPAVFGSNAMLTSRTAVAWNTILGPKVIVVPETVPKFAVPCPLLGSSYITANSPALKGSKATAVYLV